MKPDTSNLNRSITGGSHELDLEVSDSTSKSLWEKLGYCSLAAAVPAVLAAALPATSAAEGERAKTTIPGHSPRLSEKLKLTESKRALLKRQSEFRLPTQNSFSPVLTLTGADDCPGASIPGGTYTVASPLTISGDTTGANNTVNALAGYYYYGSYSASGPDNVYSFTLSSVGPNAQIEVTTTSGTYKPLIYLLNGRDEAAGSCPAGTENFQSNWWFIRDSRWTPGSNTVTLDLDSFDVNVPFYFFVDSAYADNFGSGPYTIKMRDVTVAPVPACDLPNPIDCPEWFVRQQYRDFLGREPDAPGSAHWTQEITMCSDLANRVPGETEARCIDRKRVNTSGAFYLSNEFQNSANFLIRVYWGSLGQDRDIGRKCIAGQHRDLDAVCSPLYSDYISDLAKLTQGIVVNGALDPNAINRNKHNFVKEFVTRPAFLAAYPNTITTEQFVDKLAGTIGNGPTVQERADLITRAGTEGRAAVLYDLVDGTTTIDGGALVFNTRYGKVYYDQVFNSAFVFAEYLAYLRRNPDQAGYDHWLGKLNFYGNFVDAEMVRGFIVSDEYRGRFGP